MWVSDNALLHAIGIIRLFGQSPCSKQETRHKMRAEHEHMDAVRRQYVSPPKKHNTECTYSRHAQAELLESRHVMKHMVYVHKQGPEHVPCIQDSLEDPRNTHFHLEKTKTRTEHQSEYRYETTVRTPKNQYMTSPHKKKNSEAELTLRSLWARRQSDRSSPSSTP